MPIADVLVHLRLSSVGDVKELKYVASNLFSNISNLVQRNIPAWTHFKEDNVVHTELVIVARVADAFPTDKETQKYVVISYSWLLVLMHFLDASSNTFLTLEQLNS